MGTKRICHLQERPSGELSFFSPKESSDCHKRLPLEEVVLLLEQNYEQQNCQSSYVLLSMLCPLLRAAALEKKEVGFVRLVLHFQDLWSICWKYTAHDKRFFDFMDQLLDLQPCLEGFVNFSDLH